SSIVHLIICRLPPPPRSPLFPYTTLFRSIEARERQRTGIGSLKIRYNNIFGYYIEVSRSNLPKVPGDYIRKQTLVNAERFITPRSEEHTSELQSRFDLVCRLLLEKKKTK